MRPRARRLLVLLLGVVVVVNVASVASAEDWRAFVPFVAGGRERGAECDPSQPAVQILENLFSNL